MASVRIIESGPLMSNGPVDFMLTHMAGGAISRRLSGATHGRSFDTGCG
jgi:hypothetical protein